LAYEITTGRAQEPAQLFGRLHRNLAQVEVVDRRVLVKYDCDAIRPKACGDCEIGHDLDSASHCIREILGFEREPRMRVGRDKKPIAFRIAGATQ
jgi:hypothetical protein